MCRLCRPVVSRRNVEQIFETARRRWRSLGAGRFEAIEHDDMDGVREQAAAFVDAVEAARE